MSTPPDERRDPPKILRSRACAAAAAILAGAALLCPAARASPGEIAEGEVQPDGLYPNWLDRSVAPAKDFFQFAKDGPRRVVLVNERDRVRRRPHPLGKEFALRLGANRFEQPVTNRLERHFGREAGPRGEQAMIIRPSKPPVRDMATGSLPLKYRFKTRGKTSLTISLFISN